MYCPQCGTESSEGLQYCRTCGANLKVIGKAVTLSEVIARSDRGPLPKIKEMMKNLKLEHVSEEVSRALDKMNNEIMKSSDAPRVHKPWWPPKKTAEERREKHIVRGTCGLFSGIGLMIFLYYFCGALVLKVPPDVLAKIPFELEPAVRIFWLVGLIPTLSGLGHIIAGLSIRRAPAKRLDATMRLPEEVAAHPPHPAVPGSVTERTTSLLEHDVSRSTNDLEN
ncbi:MAG: zinc ribbon domain-containing protein [Pyrinomonadaceae bacterium]|nr:zinc ribbon domain-containing protein [Pyrinomonadaceae bacterium]